VWVNETRPRLQGARLTAWELKRGGVPFKLVADNAAGLLMLSGKVTARGGA
jgi:methylthioribose-1-phosphate isomerase